MAGLTHRITYWKSFLMKGQQIWSCFWIQTDSSSSDTLLNTKTMSLRKTYTTNKTSRLKYHSLICFHLREATLMRYHYLLFSMRILLIRIHCSKTQFSHQKLSQNSLYENSLRKSCNKNLSFEYEMLTIHFTKHVN